VPAPSHFAIAGPADVECARREARSLAQRLGFGAADVECVGLAVSELATNLVRYARDGAIHLTTVSGPRGVGVEVESRDAGPGIADVGQALADGFSSSGGLGGGLPGVRRLMDDFELASGPTGTTIVARKWPSSR
jgi:serine/threonine-protein kinase RsbT